MSHNLPLSILGFPPKNSALDIGPLIKVLSKGIWASTLSITWTFQLFLIWHLKSRMQFSVMRLNAGNLNGCLLHRFCSPNPHHHYESECLLKQTTNIHKFTVRQSIDVFQGSSLVDLTDLRLLKFVCKNTHEYPIIFKALDKETRSIILCLIPMI